MRQATNFSMLLKLYRKDRGFTQTEAARYLGYSVETIKAWEYGRRFPIREDIPRLAQLFNMNAQELEQVINTSRLDTYIRTLCDKTLLLEAGMEPQDNILTLPSTLLQIIPAQSDPFSRRQTLALLTGVPAALFRLAQMHGSLALRAEEILNLCATYIPLCWNLYFEGGLPEVQYILPAYLTQISSLIQKPSFYQKSAASLASKAYQLATCVEMHHHHLEPALNNARLAFQYGKLAEDLHLQVAALIQQGNVYFSFKQSDLELQSYQQAVNCSVEISPLLRGRAYIGLAKAYAAFQQEKEALTYRDMAYESYPERPEKDSHFSYTYHTRFTLTNHTGLVYLFLDRPTYLKQAQTILTQIDEAVPKQLVPRRVELWIRQAAVSLALNDLKKSCAYVETAAVGAKTLGSSFRYQEAFELYGQLRNRWGNESRVKALKKLFQ